MVRNRFCRGSNSSYRVGRVRGAVISSSRMERGGRWSGTSSIEAANSSSRVGRVSGTVVSLSMMERGIYELSAAEDSY